ncbi:hypothetical protein [Brevibacillus agri]|uniref:hypothetical protein n=1 Tax=Brevibacillus agri TaxID=51101 RepID=UPI00046FE3D6|nr:hypothetical protein [Brevibacillus agri]WHX29529.1 hypothetical protein QNK09_20960 [Brevibacillus agri]
MNGIALLPKGKAVQKWLIALVVLGLSVSVLLPLAQLFAKAFYDKTGQFVGLDNFFAYFSTPALAQSLHNTLYISALTTQARLANAAARLKAAGAHYVIEEIGRLDEVLDKIERRQAAGEHP